MSAGVILYARLLFLTLFATLFSVHEQNCLAFLLERGHCLTLARTMLVKVMWAEIIQSISKIYFIRWVAIISNLEIKIKNLTNALPLMHSCASSSLPAEQSFTPSHFQIVGIHLPSEHTKLSFLQSILSENRKYMYICWKLNFGT